MSLHSIYVRDGRYYHHKEKYRKVFDYLVVMPEFKRICRMDVPNERFWPEKGVEFIALQELFDPKDRMSKLLRIDLGVDEVFNSINTTKLKRRGEKNKLYRKYKFKVEDDHIVDKVRVEYASCSICNRMLVFHDMYWNILTKGARQFIKQICCNNMYVRSRVSDKNGRWIFMKNPILEGPNGERIKCP